MMQFQGGLTGPSSDCSLSSGPGLSPDAHPIIDRSARVKAAVIRLEFVCLDQEWKGWQVAYRFRCRRGHRFKKRLRALVEAVGCRECAKIELFERLLAVARRDGVVCLEKHWLGNNVHHAFQCAQGHAWKRSGSYALRDATCPQCNWQAFGRKRQHADGLERLQRAAQKRGGVCLSAIYEGLDNYHEFRCPCGHRWRAKAIKILRGGWCARCAQGDRGLLKNGLARLQELAAKQGGELLSPVYLGWHAKHRLRCREGHEWAATAGSLFDGTWCKVCSIAARKKYVLSDAQRLATERGGQCISLEYLSYTTKMHWICHRGHSWHASFGTVLRGHWCKECANKNLISSSKSKARYRYLS